MWMRLWGLRAALKPRALSLPLPTKLAQCSGIVRTYATGKQCNKCGTTNTVAALQCQQCHALQPLPASVDFYDVLGMPYNTVPANGWRIDQRELKALWRRTMAIAHPDRLVNKDQDEQQLGAQQSAIVNKAYETLDQPLSRALYLVRIMNVCACVMIPLTYVDVDPQLQRAGVESVEEGMSVEDPSLLMEVMELQETLQDAEDQATVDQVGAANQEHLRDVLHELDAAFAAPHTDTDRIRQLAVQLRYWTNIEKAVREWQPGQRVELHH